MKKELTEYSTTFYEKFTTSSSINEMWLDFKHNCIETLTEHVPSKMTTTRFNQPWIDRNTRRLSRRKKRAYRKARNTNNKKTWTVTKTSRSRTNKAVEKRILIMSGTWSPRTKEQAVRSCTRLSKTRNVMAQEWLH
jgi:hypothetical protein